MPASPVCSSLVLAPGWLLAEPFLAVHPTKPATLALATNAIGISPDVNQPANGMMVFITEDLGASWRIASAPTLPGGGHADVPVLADPSLAFLPDDTLVLGGMNCPARMGCEIIVATSKDLGATWNGWNVISDRGDVDREWIAVTPNGTLLMDWTAGGRVHVLESVDGGQAWMAVDSLADCIGASPIEFLHLVPYIACVDFTGDQPEGIRLSSGSSGGSWDTMDDQRGLQMTWPRVLAAPDGPMLILEDYQNSSVAVRQRSNGSWSPILHVRDLVSVDDSWTRTFSHWEALDAWGRLHLIIGGEVDTPLAGPDPDRLAAAYAHVVLAGDRLLWEQPLTPDPAVQPSTLPLGTPVVQSDYAGLVFSEDVGVLAWPDEGGIAITWLRAV